jgi:hypothetical protein
MKGSSDFFFAQLKNLKREVLSALTDKYLLVHLSTDICVRLNRCVFLSSVGSTYCETIKNSAHLQIIGVLSPLLPCLYTTVFTVW